MTRRVLIVTSSYAPAMIADMHRVRHLAWELPKIGWQVEILCPDDSYQQSSCMDADSSAFFAPGTVIHRVSQYFGMLFRRLGFGGIGWRALIPMFFAGRRLLRKRTFDLVYFSTTQFPLFLLGPAWQSGQGVPFVLDIHDPCYKEESATPAWIRPGLKHRLARWLSKHIEASSVTAASGLVAVSPEYIRTLRQRYEDTRPGWLREGRHATIPFAVSASDFDEAAGGAKTASATDEQSIRIVYVGAGAPVMQRSFTLLCRALAYLREHEAARLDRVRIEVYGTMLGWQEGGPRHMADIARAMDIGDLVHEHPRRVSYRGSVELLLEGDGVLVLGVDDPGYMPSKLFSYALSGKPLLAVMRKDSSAFAQIRGSPGLGHAIWFDDAGDMPGAAAALEVGEFLREAAGRSRFDRGEALEPFMAPRMARRHAELFEACLQSGPPSA